MKLLKVASFVSLLITVTSAINDEQMQAEHKKQIPAARLALVDELKQLANGTRSMFDIGNIRNSPVMQSLVQRLTRGDYMTQPQNKKKTVLYVGGDNTGVSLDKLTSVDREKLFTALKQASQQGQQKTGVNLKNWSLKKGSDYFKEPSDGDKADKKVFSFPILDTYGTSLASPRLSTIAGAVGLGALALGALIATPIALSANQKDDPYSKSWIDSLKFWKKGDDEELLYDTPVNTGSGHQDEYYNPYFDIKDSPTRGASIRGQDHSTDSDDYVTDYDYTYQPHDYHDKEDIKKDDKKHLYYSDDEFWDDHYVKDDVIYEKGVSPISSDRLPQDNRKVDYEYRYKVKEPDSFTRVSDYPTSYVGSSSDNRYHVDESFSSNADSSFKRPNHSTNSQKEPPQDKIFITVDEVNKIANQSLSDILAHYRAFIRRIDTGNVIQIDNADDDAFAESVSSNVPKTHSTKSSGNSAQWQPLKMAKESGTHQPISSTPQLQKYQYPSDDFAIRGKGEIIDATPGQWQEKYQEQKSSRVPEVSSYSYISKPTGVKSTDSYTSSYTAGRSKNDSPTRDFHVSTSYQSKVTDDRTLEQGPKFTDDSSSSRIFRPKIPRRVPARKSDSSFQERNQARIGVSEYAPDSKSSEPSSVARGGTVWPNNPLTREQMRYQKEYMDRYGNGTKSADGDSRRIKTLESFSLEF